MSGKNKYTIAEAIQKLAGAAPRAKHLLEGVVAAVSGGTCTVYFDVLGLEIDDVELWTPSESKTLKVNPETGSRVVVAVTDLDIMYVVKYGSIASVEIGGGKYGVLKAEDLIDKLTQLDSAIKAGFTSVGGGYTGVSFGGLINENVRHGN